MYCIAKSMYGRILPVVDVLCSDTKTTENFAFRVLYNKRYTILVYSYLH